MWSKRSKTKVKFHETLTNVAVVLITKAEESGEWTWERPLIKDLICLKTLKSLIKF